MVDRGYNVELELAIAAGLEDARVDLDLFYSRTVKLAECGDDTCFLPCTRRTIDE